MLIVVKNGDRTAPCQLCFNFKALGCLDILEVDAAKRVGDVGHGVDKAGTVLGVDFNVYRVDAGEALEQQCLAFHDGLARQRTQIAQAQHGGAVADYRNQIALAGIQICGIGIGGDFTTGFGNTGAVGQRQFGLGFRGLGQLHADFSGNRLRVIVEGRLSEIFAHSQKSAGDCACGRDAREYRKALAATSAGTSRACTRHKKAGNPKVPGLCLPAAPGSRLEPLSAMRRARQNAS